MVGLVVSPGGFAGMARLPRVAKVTFPKPKPCAHRYHRKAQISARAAEEAAPQELKDEEEDVVESEEDKSEEYTDVMQQRMGTTLTYRHEDGMNYSRILDDLIVGSCLQTPDDADKLAGKEDVRTVLSLQEDSDMAYFDLDLAPIKERILERGAIAHNRFPIRDFDPFSLRMRLPGAVALLDSQAQKNGGTAYVHCTAGLGRAPATALAWMWWVKGIPLEEAFEQLRSIRPCSPRLFAVRQAAVDLLYGSPPTPVTVAVWRKGLASSVQVAGLDVGWGQQVDLQLCPATKRFVATRNLPPGSYQFKFIVDGRWTYSADHHTTVDGGNTNNCVEVPHSNNSQQALEGRRRLLAEGGQLQEEERAKILQLLKEIAAASGDNSAISGSAPTPA